MSCRSREELGVCEQAPSKPEGCPMQQGCAQEEAHATGPGTHGRVKGTGATCATTQQHLFLCWKPWPIVEKPYT